MKKSIITAMLVGVIAIGGGVGLNSIVTFATQPFKSSGHTKYLPGSDSWTRGIKQGAPGWYLTYSYYYNPSYVHGSGVYTKQDDYQPSELMKPGKTAIKNAPSVPDYDRAYTSAAVRKNGSGSLMFSSDRGYGEYRDYNMMRK